MTFDEAYRQLEDEFRKRVKEDNRSRGSSSIFLPNMAPTAPVDYVPGWSLP